jgi:hypothetical protein
MRRMGAERKQGEVLDGLSLPMGSYRRRVRKHFYRRYDSHGEVADNRRAIK